MSFLKNIHLKWYWWVAIALVVLIIIFIITRPKTPPVTAVKQQNQPIVQPSGVSTTGANPTNPSNTVVNVYPTASQSNGSTGGYIELSGGGWTDGNGYYVGPNYEQLVNTALPWNPDSNPVLG